MRFGLAWYVLLGVAGLAWYWSAHWGSRCVIWAVYVLLLPAARARSAVLRLGRHPARPQRRGRRT
ncbi:hypothetical protein [Kitasatospora camelliae]|uniref:Uncharacterized protein n=1 Tax=Kitasatospora camelliae TaxID=3156397 RepID=A0AAU8K6Y6_9ACTN